MNYEKTESHKLIRKEIRSFLKKELEPIVDEIDRDGIFPEVIFKDLMKLGYLSLILPEEYGGGGHDFFGTAIIAEELAKACAGLYTSAFGHIFCQHWIDMFGTKEQKEKYLPELSEGNAIGAIAITEPDAGSNVAGILTSAREDGDDFILDGRKTFITNGSIADIICVVTVTEPDAKPRGISTLIVETKAPGFSAEKPMKKLGNRCSPTCEIVFENCRVPKENLLGTRNKSLVETTRFFSFERVAVAVACAGIAEAAMESARDYARQRKQFGVPIATFQGIQEMLADMATDIYATRCMCEDLLDHMEKGEYLVEKASMAKAFASEMVNRHTSNAIQIFGGYGYTAEFPVERYFRDARVFSIGGGTTQIQRRLIARSIIGKI
ncbi:MAG: acyl-CoA dehydrogenase family protein [Desulfobacterales bacterium]